jgi:prevent-host-death family protein
MPRTFSASEAKHHFGEFLRIAREEGEVIVERDGEPIAALISLAEYRRIKGIVEKARRADLLAKMRALQERTAAQNTDLTPEQIEEIANEVSRDVTRRIARKRAVLVTE